MALFERLFAKKILESTCNDSRKGERSSKVTTEQVRLLLFKDSDWRGRKVLFDSSTIEKVRTGKDDKPSIRQPDEAPCIVEVVEGYSYLYKGPAADTSRLGEMIFGEVAMNCKGVSLKIHIMNEPRRLLCTKVFCVPASHKISKVERKASDRNSSADLRSESNPLNVPAAAKEGMSLSFSLDRGDSGYCGDQPPSSYSSIGSTRDYFSMFGVWDGVPDTQEDFVFHSPPGRKLSTSSNGSWQRRTFQNLATRFDLSQSSNLLSVPTASSNFTNSDSQVYSNSSASGTSDSLVSTGCGAVRQQTRRNKLGLALLITVTDNCEMDVVKSCIEHSSQLQALVCRLRLATLAAGAGTGFVSTLYQAVVDAAKWLSDLVYGPRLPALWLTLLTSDSRTASKTADKLLTDLCSVLSVADTKHTNFFISTLLTHVLTYHLGWVTTVSPYDTLDPHKKATDSIDEPGSSYNALWAQLNDLCGSIGFPPRAARTIICGTNNEKLVNRLLVVLTYFVRSGDIKKSEFKYEDCVLKETRVVCVNQTQMSGMKRTKTVNKLDYLKSTDSLKVPEINALDSDSSVSTLVASEPSIMKSKTLANLSQQLSSLEFTDDCSSSEKPMTSQLRRNRTSALPVKASPDSSLNSSLSVEFEEEQKVVFVLGDNEKLVGLKNKSNGGKSVKKSSKVQNVPEKSEVPDVKEDDTKESCDQKILRSPDSPSRCCAQTLQHSKPIKHSGFKFEFDKYPQIVTNYMKSKNLEILDRHYIGKPGNLKLDNFQFDPTVVPVFQEERCEICYKCQQMESMLQTPTNASEMEYMNDIPRTSEPQYATETFIKELDTKREISPKTFIRQKAQNTIVVNIRHVDAPQEIEPSISVEVTKAESKKHAKGMEIDKLVRVKEIVEFPMPKLLAPEPSSTSAGFDGSLLGGVTDHYVPDLILQGTLAKPNVWEKDLRRDLDLTCYLNKSLEVPMQAVAIIGDTNSWDVRVVGRGCGATGGMSALVAAMLEPLPAMLRARVPAHQCLSFLEGKLREFCVLSKTLADMLMSTDFCDIATLTKSLNIDVNDVPLLLAVATTHTPQVATRYGISYR